MGPFDQAAQPALGTATKLPVDHEGAVGGLVEPGEVYRLILGFAVTLPPGHKVNRRGRKRHCLRLLAYVHLSPFRTEPYTRSLTPNGS